MPLLWMRDMHQLDKGYATVDYVLHLVPRPITISVLDVGLTFKSCY
jgi:hypothetical protein